MQNVMKIATIAGHTAQNDGWTAQNDGRTAQNDGRTAQNDGWTAQNDGRNTLNVCQGPKGGLEEPKQESKIQDFVPFSIDPSSPTIKRDILIRDIFKFFSPYPLFSK